MTNSKSSSRRRFLENLGTAGVVGGMVGATRANAASNSAPPSAHHYFDAVLNPSFVDERIDCRSATPENPTGERGFGCESVVLDGARKSWKAGQYLAPGEKAVLADIKGPGTVRHIWSAQEWRRPEAMRSLRLES